MANTFTLSGTSLDAENNPAYAGRYMVLRVTSVGTDTEDAASYPQDSVSALIGTDGTWSFTTLWVNGDSGILSYYEMKEPSGQRVEFVFPSGVEGTTVRYEFALENYLAADAEEQVAPALGAHIADLGNPHQVTADQVSLGATDDVTFAEITGTGQMVVPSIKAPDANGIELVSITGGTIGTLGAGASQQTSLVRLVLDTDLAIAEGGTGASTAAAARDNLGITDIESAAASSFPNIRDDNDQYYEFPHNTFFDPGANDFSFAFWASFAIGETNQGGKRTICRKGNDFHIYIGNSNQGEIGVEVSGETTGTLGPFVEDSKWHYYVVNVNRGASADLYIDGNLTDSITQNSSTALNEVADLLIFNSAAGGGPIGSWANAVNFYAQTALSTTDIANVSNSYMYDVSAFVVSAYFERELVRLNRSDAVTKGSDGIEVYKPTMAEAIITDTDSAFPTSGAVVDYAQPADENIAGPTTDVTSTSYTVLSSDRILLVNDTTAGADVTINIPSAATLGDGWQLVVKKVGTDFDIILDPAGTETIDGVLTRSLHQKNDTFVIVSDGTNWEIASRNVVLGWANYVDSTHTSGSELLLNAGNTPDAYIAQCTVDGLGSGSSAAEWPNGVPEPWDTTTNKLIGTNDGDKFTYELSFKAQDGAAAVLMDVYIDIGDGITPFEISRSSVSIAKGASVETSIEMYRTYFTGSTFVTNGGTIYFDTSQGSDDMSIWDIALLIEKTHVAS